MTLPAGVTIVHDDLKVEQCQSITENGYSRDEFRKNRAELLKRAVY